MGGAGQKKKHLPAPTLFMPFPVAKVWSYPTQSVPESSRFAFGSGLGILIGSPGGHWGFTSHRLLRLRLPGRIAEFVKDVTRDPPQRIIPRKYGEFFRYFSRNQAVPQGSSFVQATLQKKRQEYSEIGYNMFAILCWNSLFDFHYFCRRQI